MKIYNTIGRYIVFAVFAFCTLLIQAEEDTNLYYRVFALGGSIDRIDHYQPPSNSDMRAVLSAQDQQITWPPGSMAIQVALHSWHLIARNTNENLHRIAAISWPEFGSQCAFESMIIAFKKNDIEKLNMGAGVSKKTLFGLKQQGRSKLISTAHAVTRLAQEAEVKNIREVIYPYEQLVGVDTNQSCNPRIVVPETFNTLEIGTTLQVIPELDEGGRFINLTVKSKWTTIKGWEKYEVVAGSGDELKKFSVRMPLIDSASIETQLAIQSGDTVLLGGGKDVDSEWIYYHFLKAEILRPTHSQQILAPKPKER